MLSIYTKQIAENGRWYSSTTYNCYDHLEDGKTPEEAAKKMTILLRKLGYHGELDFKTSQPYVCRPKVISNGNYPRPEIFRIDKGMV